MDSWMVLYAIGIIYFAVVIGIVIRCFSKDDLKEVAWLSIIAPIVVIFIIITVLIDILTEKEYYFKTRLLNLCKATWFYLRIFPVTIIIFLDEVSKSGIFKWNRTRKDLMYYYKNKYIRFCS
ncbi:hypothetical protein [Abyssisolibacter fermentans]|uniref:hypothetical protein n=1 Tax=Abyssisolibacter fermentans TaxID=1766203 RepID=UPI00082B490C|nr:hypothetical protein [Abyssisolibacter fermentans]